MKTKVLVIGDIHWLDVWENLVEENSFDKVVFLWDYVDSFNFSDCEIIDNLRNIIQYKKDNSEKVILLLWNHDIQYIYEGNNCSWRRESYAGIIGSLFKENLDLFKIVYKEWEYVFSHAWFTQQWMMDNANVISRWDDHNWSWEVYNNILNTRDRNILFQCWIWRWGFAQSSWPIWADKSETATNWIPWILQIVGHSHVPKIIDLGHIIYCDVLEYWDWIPLILTIENNE